MMYLEHSYPFKITYERKSTNIIYCLTAQTAVIKILVHPYIIGRI
jgi:hypothetical protein